VHLVRAGPPRPGITTSVINQGREKVQLVATKPPLPDWTLAARAFHAMATRSEAGAP
jgi:hypothetical protein